MHLNILPKNIPEGCVLGVNYSGMHDSSVALVGPDGQAVFAVALERLTRVKQDGRLPRQLLEEMPWNKIARVAVSVSRELDVSTPRQSRAHPLPLAVEADNDGVHEPRFFDIEKLIPCAVEYVPHHLCHAASAFWASGYDEALCLVYDGGMSNEAGFGGLYRGRTGQVVETLDTFFASRYSNVAHLYSAVTALLGFTPVKHEGKITGLAAFGKPTPGCSAVLHRWLTEPGILQHLMHWQDMYSAEVSPRMVVNARKLQLMASQAKGMEREELAATVQAIAESHVLEILANARSLGLASADLCLSGGLFANVKINQRAAEAGFERVFVSPPMSDDGTALGAAWHVVSQMGPLKLEPLRSVFLGPSYTPAESEAAVAEQAINVLRVKEPAMAIAEQLAAGRIVAVFQGASEFGPRALGNRSILASARDADINKELNRRLGRTEFMPFAPVVRSLDADVCFLVRDGIAAACRFMTMTVPCTNDLATASQAVVHVDNTARPQLVDRPANPLVFEILTRYGALTGQRVLVNTSFNVHEEPIVCSPEDALRGFFESGLDALFIEGVGLILRTDNLLVENQFLRQKMASSKGLRSSVESSQREQVGPITADLVQFPATGPGIVHLAEGFHAPEPWGAWSNGRYSRLTVSSGISDGAGLELHITILIKVYEGLLPSAPVVRILADGVVVGYVLFREAAPAERKIDFYCPMDRPACEIEFELSANASLLVSGASNDTRELGFALCGISTNVSAVRLPQGASAADPVDPEYWV
jgi:carbamoyltransferase